MSIFEGHRLWHVQPLKGVCLPRIQSLLSRGFTPFKKGSQMHIKVTQERLNNSRVRTRGVVECSSIRVIALGALVEEKLIGAGECPNLSQPSFPTLFRLPGGVCLDNVLGFDAKGFYKAEASGLAMDFRIRC